MDTTIPIHYKGKVLKGHLVISSAELPYFYWCFLDEPELVKHLGDCIGFRNEGDGILTATETHPAEYKEIIGAIKAQIEKMINR